jgi:hypothetical protein
LSCQKIEELSLQLQ